MIFAVRSAGPLVAVLCLAEVLGMLGNATFPALIPTFREVWGLNNAEAGWISGIYYLGYVLAVPVLVSLTDREDAWLIYLGSTALGGLAALAFAWLAEGLWSALLFRFIGGVGLAGTYMVGLKLLSDRVGGAAQSRGVAFYTATFSIGTAVSVLAAGEAATAYGWPVAFEVAALGSLLAMLLLFLAVEPGGRPQGRGALASALDLRPVLRNKRALAYILGYGTHVWELFGYRSWIVAFLAFAAARHGLSSDAWSPTQIATLLLLLGLPASILGNEAAVRFGRRRTVASALALSGLMVCGLGFAAGLPFWSLLLLLAVYGVAIMADSGALTAGAVAAADPAKRGATMALHAFVGFGAGVVSPLVLGAVLDIAGGEQSLTAWGLAFASLALGPAVGVVVLLRVGRSEAA